MYMYMYMYMYMCMYMCMYMYMCVCVYYSQYEWPSVVSDIQTRAESKRLYVRY